MDLLFDFMAEGSRRASVIGTMTRSLAVSTTGPVDLFGVRFRPGGLSELFALDAAKFTDKRADLADLWGQFAQETWHRLGEKTAIGRVGLLQKLLGGLAKGRAQIDPFIQHCVTRIETSRGNLRIGALETSTGLSTRQLERKFARCVGISPKTFARVVRFKAVLEAATSTDQPDWVRLAVDFGFSDQPHLVREIKALAGVTTASFVTPDKVRN
jgi:AraC-like DNA-binding protein